ncbi:Hypothetical protein Minf_1532 [Methylacidiphilum infernorum V4]|uniref:Uncharacterized protein n=1 Tax=Methylacidiphilum infernorum (isolate V4) TaxID=481448 RepID=B3DW83_METI4|nr:Hypothetical protein Minf_1532 [Methylacidiphilum infernorum V4]
MLATTIEKAVRGDIFLNPIMVLKIFPIFKSKYQSILLSFWFTLALNLLYYK